MKELNAQSEYMEKSPPCLHCNHLLTVGDNTEFRGWKCKAFPEGIPPVILKGRISHEAVIDLYPGQVLPYLFSGKERNGKTFDYEGNLS